MIYLSLSVYAEIVTDKFYYVCVSDRSQTNLRMAQINAFPYTISGSTDYSTLFISWHTNQVIQDNTIVVAQIVIDNLRDNPTTPFQIGIGQLASGAITNANSGSFYYDMPYDQEIISTTIAKISDGTRITVTFKANGFTNAYPFIRIYPIIREEMGHVLSGVRYDLYQSIEEAAGSGVTPEEMRNVLSSWGQDELIPGIGEEVGDQIEDKVPGAVEDALNNHDQHQENQAGSKIDEFKEQLEETINPYFENTTEIRDALHGGLTGVFGYSGTNAVITFPAANNPMADGAVLWPELTVDLGYWWNRLPAALRSMITIYATFVILYCCLSEMLDTINTILIHRELLGMPDDAFGIKAKSWSE